MLQLSSIQALVNLVDDPDDQIYQHVRGELVKCGTTALPILESTWETDLFGSKHHERIDKIIQEIQFEDVKKDLTNWLNSADKDLVKGACAIAKYENPSLDESEIMNSIQNIRRDIWLELNDNQTSFEKVKIFNKIFFSHHKFEGDKDDYFSPANSLIHKVLETRKGNPLSLSLLYSVIAQSLDLPIYGVNLPNHFVLAYMDVNGIHAQNDQENEYGVLFYINTFARGSIFDTEEIKSFLDGLKVEYKRDFFEPCSNTAIIRRMLTNLISSYQQTGKSKIIDDLVELRSILD
jgi:regulator of sirC expression with transglutaminase-like and TPR domain